MIVFENRFAIIMNYENCVLLYDRADFSLSMRRVVSLDLRGALAKPKFEVRREN